MSYICDGTESDKIAKLIKSFIEKSYWSNFTLEFKKYPFTIKLTFRDTKGDYISTFTLVQQINCCGILVSTKTDVNKTYQGRGIAQEMMYLKESLAKEFGYSLLMATVNMTGNPAEVHILEKFDWKLNTSFTNSRTKNQVGIYTKEIK